MTTSSLPDPSLAVVVEGVTQRFSLRHEKTLKGRLVGAMKGHPPNTETFLALDDVNLAIPAGTTMGLIGHNGSGKSTLLKIIGGVLTPTWGQVSRRGRLAALLELGAGFHRDLSGRENIYLNAEILGLARSEISRRFDDIVEFSGVEQFIDTPMKYYSSGMFVRLGFSVAIHTDPDVLLVDEVLAVGDEQFKAKCLDVIRTMQNEGRTIILVTHSMDQVTQFCDAATLLHHGQVRAQGAPVEVIAAFRELNQPNAIGNKTPPAKDAEDRATTGSRAVATVVRVEGRAVSGRPLAELRSGDTVALDATITRAPASDPCVIRVEIFHGGQLLMGTTTDRIGLETFTGEGQVTVSLLLEDLPLAPGSYRIAVSTANSRAAPPDHTLPAAVEFKVVGEAPSIGPVVIKPRVTGLARP